MEYIVLILAGVANVAAGYWFHEFVERRRTKRMAARVMARIEREEADVERAVAGLMDAYSIVHANLIQTMKERRSISHPDCRKLRRVLDYLDARLDGETEEWSEVIGG